ncbi:hypothetical protein SAMN05444483_101139 [Salegentibacter echinorum]|uniref:Uncharacterized protein n=1 Tax=Salegentibacter echinorum TaxID=1073325 RepID=A0A1M5BQD0_SALEC|nr:hypothetical protein SAMN05444483_101139 [Salegentibacter echinorum]
MLVADLSVYFNSLLVIAYFTNSETLELADILPVLFANF